MFKLIDSDEDLKVYEHLGYEVSVITRPGRKIYSVELSSTADTHNLPVLTLCGEEFIVNSPTMRDAQIDEIISGLETAKQFIRDFNENRDRL